jgi:lipopolysaccharide/colanic/teichoic acid biosynthesis glycosyltransferase
MSNAQQIITSSLDGALGAFRRPRLFSRAAAYLRRDRRKLATAASLLGGDILAGWVAIIAVHAAANVLSPAVASDIAARPSIALLMLIFLVLGLYSSSARCSYARFRTRCMGILLFAAIYFVGRADSTPLWHLTLEAVGYGCSILVCGFFVELAIRRVLIRTGLWMAPTVIVGDGAASRTLYETFASQPELGFRPIGFILSRAPEGDDERAALPGPVIGSVDDLNQLADTVEVAVLTSGEQMGLIHRAGGGPPALQYIILNSPCEMPTLWLRFRPMGSAVGIQVERDPYLCQNYKLKRAMDLAIALPFAILSLPLIGLLALLIWMLDGASPFYTQPRVGKGGRTFNIPKLRSMRVDASQRLAEYLEACPEAKEEWERYFKLRDDPRILPIIGNFIRRSSLDELPQLWSVIIGDMSLVGPRPFPAYHLNCFDAEFRRIRYAVPPGLTGLWQVTERSNGDVRVQELQDTFYIRNWSVWLDLYILFMTVPALVINKGAR